MANKKAFLLLTGTAVLGGFFLAVIGDLGDEPKSPIAWLQYPLLLFLAWGALTTPVDAQIKARFIPFVFLSWLLGMSVELTLTVDGSGIGGVHPDTVASFILAQGDYIPLGILVWAFHRWMGCLMYECAWVVTGIALTEGLVFTGSVTASISSGSFIGALIVTCYLIALYMVYLLLPFRLCGVGLEKVTTTKSILLLVLAGFVSAFVVRSFWGLIYSPLISTIFDLPLA
ncbi:hypothetical protein [Jannaschia pohangensis]|uniref:Uncharacterized protein n=1 Tax=Jannaschia pohangensis TaxID=390807 RepID=A0A1I3LKS2_9RHOB|nr:hypothetical protein [Jannaschia pohangensis]SFI85332.1 hypothetical protein SAMN04488095_1563 [Jannaschia pohangensis]